MKKLEVSGTGSYSVNIAIKNIPLKICDKDMHNEPLLYKMWWWMDKLILLENFNITFPSS